MEAHGAQWSDSLQLASCARPPSSLHPASQKPRLLGEYGVIFRPYHRLLQLLYKDAYCDERLAVNAEQTILMRATQATICYSGDCLRYCTVQIWSTQVPDPLYFPRCRWGRETSDAWSMQWFSSNAINSSDILARPSVLSSRGR